MSRLRWVDDVLLVDGGRVGCVVEASACAWAARLFTKDGPAKTVGFAHTRRGAMRLLRKAVVEKGQES